MPSQTGNSRSRTALALLHRLSSTQPRAVSASSRAYACAPVNRFSIFAFTSSPTCRNPHTHNAISVKALLAVPSPSPQAFTHISLCINNLRNKGEEVKEKNRNCLTGACAYARERSHFRVSHPCGAVTNESNGAALKSSGVFCERWLVLVARPRSFSEGFLRALQ